MKNRIGEKFITNQGYEVEIIEYFGALNTTVQFNDKNKTMLKNISFAKLSTGSLKFPLHPTVCGVGYLGIGKYTYSYKIGDIKIIGLWKSMINRCYNKKVQIKHPTYIGCSVCDEWFNFQNYAQWFEENYNPKTMSKWELDKDLICPDCKLYSPENCAFIPRIINTFFHKGGEKKSDLPLGLKMDGTRIRVTVSKGCVRENVGTFGSVEEALKMRKQVKENYAKELADKYKNTIDFRVYERLYNYKE